MNIQELFSRFKKPQAETVMKFGEDGNFTHPEDSQLEAEAAQFDGENNIEPDISMADKVQDRTVEAGIPQNTNRSKKSNMHKLKFYLIFLGGIILIVLGGFSFMKRDFLSIAEPKAKTDNVASQNKAKNFDADKLAIEKLEAAQKQAASAAAVEQKPPLLTPVTPIATKAKSSQITPAQRELMGNVLLADATANKSNANEYKQGMLKASANQNEESRLGKSLQPTAMPATTAQQRADLTYLLRKGTNIPCTLDTQIITTQAGLTRCSVTKDVYSANGKVLLIERGSTLNGEQTAALLQGQARIFVLWSSVETPNGISVNINSPSAGQLGAAGNAANVDYHFWQRFGGAILISLIQDLGNSVNKSGADNNSVSFQSTTNSAEDLATEVLKNTIKIPPTGYVNQGSLINVMVARDVDFSGVYELVNINN